MLGVTVGGAGVEITSARNVGIEHLYAIYGGSMLAIVFRGLKELWGPSKKSFSLYAFPLPAVSKVRMVAPKPENPPKSFGPQVNKISLQRV